MYGAYVVLVVLFALPQFVLVHLRNGGRMGGTKYKRKKIEVLLVNRKSIFHLF
jgi:hypothetical protein